MAYKVSSARLPDRNADCVVVAQEAGGWWYHLIVFTLSAHLHILSTRCLITGDIPLPGWRPAPALACLHKDIPHPTPSLARLHTDPRFRIEVTLESSLTMIYVLLYP